MVGCVCQICIIRHSKEWFFVHGNDSLIKRTVGNHWRVFSGGITLSSVLPKDHCGRRTVEREHSEWTGWEMIAAWTMLVKVGMEHSSGFETYLESRMSRAWEFIRCGMRERERSQEWCWGIWLRGNWVDSGAICHRTCRKRRSPRKTRGEEWG